MPVPLLSVAALDGGTSLDLTQSALRNVAADEREFPRSIDPIASLTVGLTHRDKLWGMLACHRGTPYVAGPELRAVGNIVGQVVSLLIESLGQAEIAARRNESDASLRALVGRLADPLPMAGVLRAAQDDVLGLFGASGALVRISETASPLGDVPDTLQAKCVMALLHAEGGGDLIAYDDLAARLPEFASRSDAASGAMYMPINPGTDDAVLLLRTEMIGTIEWGGHLDTAGATPGEAGRIAQLASPNRWRETVHGLSAPWTEADLAIAGDFGRAVAAEIARRAEADFARLNAERGEIINRNAMLLAAIDASPVAFSLTDATQPNLPIIYVNRMFSKISGYSAAESIGCSSGMLNGPATDPVALAELERTVRSGERAEVHLIKYRKDGSEFLCNFVVEPIKDDSGTCIAYLRMMSDMTDEAKNKATIQRQKMEALGRMIGGVAHEVNNMLAPVILLSQHLMDKELVVPEGRSQLSLILESAGNARSIIGNLLQFSRTKSASPGVHDPAVLLNDGMQIVRRAVPATTALEVRIEGQPPHVTIDKTAFVQILLNLVSNASAATDGIGHVKVVLDGIDQGRELKRFARLRVSDDGHGMDQATLERAFEPFFTTKAVGQGTGLGLSVIFGLVHEAHGTIELQSEPGQGTTAIILLPEHSGDT